MEIQNSSLQDFVGFSSTADLITKGQQNSGIQPQPQPQLQSQGADSEKQIISQPLPLITAEEILKKAAEKKEGSGEEVVNGEAEDTETPNEETPPAEQPAAKQKAGRPSSKLPEGIADVIKELDEKGVLIGLADGKYETITDFIDLIKANDESKKDTLREEVKNEVFGSFNPVQQALIQYAGMGVQSVQDLIPMLTAMDNYDYSMSLDINNPEHHEEIVRNSLAIQGLPNDAIESEISEIRGVEGKMETRAKTLKPALDKYNEQRLQAEYQRQYKVHQEHMNFWKSHEVGVRQTILEKDTIDGVKYSKDERTQMYLALSKPDPKTGDLPIYSLIDALIEKKDFQTLAEIYQLGTNKKSYKNKLGTSVVASSAESTQRQLRITTKNTPVDATTNETKKLQRPNTYRTPSLEM